jgi:hypothetical protein
LFPSGIRTSRRMLDFPMNPFLFHQVFLLGQLHDRMAHDTAGKNVARCFSPMPS